MTKEEIQQEIEKLESSLTGDMLTDMSTKEQIHKLTMLMNNVESVHKKPNNSDFECIGCGS